MKDKSKFKKAMFQYSMLESSVTWWEKELNKVLNSMERLPRNHPSIPRKRQKVQFILKRLHLEEKNIANYFKENEDEEGG